jgi:hypothetical protein
MALIQIEHFDGRKRLLTVTTTDDKQMICVCANVCPPSSQVCTINNKCATPTSSGTQVCQYGPTILDCLRVQHEHSVRALEPVTAAHHQHITLLPFTHTRL